MGYRILCLTPWFPDSPTDGHYNFIYHSVEALRRAGHDVTVLFTRPWTPRVFRHFHPDWDRKPIRTELFDSALNLKICHFPSIPRGYWYELSGPLYRMGVDRHIRKLIRDYNIQIIHAHTETAAFAAVPLAREVGIPSLLTIHGINMAPRLLNTALKRERLRRTLDGSDRVVLVGEPIREYFKPLAGRDDHFRVVPNGFYLPDELRKAHVPVKVDELRIISVSNLHEGKGIDLNIQALAQLNQEGITNWNYMIIGGGGERENLERMVSASGLQGKVRFLGAQPHDKVFEFLQQSDVFLLPSYREAFGVAYLEAMATGLLTIGIKGQGPEAFIQDGTTGILLTPQDVTAITSALKWCAMNPKQVREIAAAGQRHVWDECTWDRHAEKLTAVFAEVLG